MLDLHRAKQASYHPVEGGAVVFDAADMKLFALNDTAAFIWSIVRDRESVAEVVAALQASLGITKPVATRWLDEALSPFRQNDAPRSGRELSRQARSVRIENADAQGNSADYFLLGHGVRIFAAEETLELLAPLLESLRVQGRARVPDTVIHVHEAQAGRYLVGDGQTEIAASKATLVGVVEQAVVQAVVPATPHLLTFHAALLRRNEAGILLAAPSGSGKTTLSIALSRSGWSFGGDELALLCSNHNWRGLPLPPCVKAENVAVIRQWLPDIDRVPEQQRFSRAVKFAHLNAEEFSVRVRHVVFPHFSNDAKNRLEPLDGLKGLTKLLEQCVFVPKAFSIEDVETLLAWHRGTNYWQLTFQDCHAAISLINSGT